MLKKQVHLSENLQFIVYSYLDKRLIAVSLLSGLLYFSLFEQQSDWKD